jgi:hypothetical protein
MVDKKLIDRLDEDGLIDKRHVLWWQLGFEGRRIMSEEEFNSGLKEVTHEYITPNDGIGKETLNVWTKNNVPILLRDIKFREDLEIPCFISVKPMSHGGGRDLEFKLPISLYSRPHIRGIVIEATDEFLFWYPLIFNRAPIYYETTKFTFNDPSIPPALICPIHPSKFYKNLIKNGWAHGRRCQKRAKRIICNESQQIVPYYEFNPKKTNLTVYPSPIFEGELDFPIILTGDPSGIPKIIGTGYFDFSEYRRGSGGANYWELDKEKERKVRKVLIRRLGNVNQSLQPPTY